MVGEDVSRVCLVLGSRKGRHGPDSPLQSQDRMGGAFTEWEVGGAHTRGQTLVQIPLVFLRPWENTSLL